VGIIKLVFAFSAQCKLHANLIFYQHDVGCDLAATARVRTAWEKF